MDIESHNNGAIKLDLTFVPDVEALINWLQCNISDMENLLNIHQHVLDSDDEFTLMTCKVALLSLSRINSTDNSVVDNI